MARQVKIRRGNSSQVAAFTPALGELIADTTLNQLVLGNGVTVGGAARFLNSADIADLFETGIYTPTLTNTANVAASTAYACQYIHIGTVVLVSGRVDIDPTLTTTQTQLRLSLPVPSTIGASYELAGVAFAAAIAGQGAAVRGVVGTNVAEIAFMSGDITNQQMFFIFAYVVNG